MTSRISFRRLLKEELRHHLAIFIIYIALLFAYVMEYVMRIQGTLMLAKATELKSAEVAGQLLELCRPIGYIAVFIAALGIFAAVEGYSYLHSKRKMDFFGALAVKRSRRFTVVFVAELLMFLVTLVANTILCMLIVSMTGYASSTLILNVLYTNLAFLVVFLLSFATATLAMMLTGNLFVAVCGTCGFFAYMPVVRLVLLNAYAGLFFSTYAEIPLTKAEYCLSPSTLIYKLYVPDEGGWSIQAKYPWMLVIVLVALLILLVAAYLHQKRPSECAGTAMAFPRFNGILEILIVVPVALLLGLIVSVFAPYGEAVWMLIGVIAGLVGGHVIMSSAFSFDVKESVKNLRYFVISAVICAVVLVFSVFDITGYDKWLPKESEVTAVLINDNTSDSNYTSSDLNGVPAMSKETIQTALNFANEAMRENLVTEKIDGKKHRYTYQVVSVFYVLDSGRVVQRNYTVREGFDTSALNTLYNQEDYKTCISWNNDKYLQNPTSGYVSSVFSDYFDLTKEQIEELYQVYREEYASMGANEIVKGEYFYSFSIVSEHNYSYHDQTFNIYPSFQKTYQYLEKLGIRIVDLKDCEITKIKVRSEVWTSEYAYDYTVYELTDPEKIQEFKDQLAIGFLKEVSSFGDDYYVYDLSVTLKDKKTGEIYEDITANALESVKKEIMKEATKVSQLKE